MADLVSIATGNLTAAATWGQTDATSKLVSTNTGVSSVGISNVDSATFTPGAITVIGFCLRITGKLANGNTCTATLRNSTDAVNVVSVTFSGAATPTASNSGNDSYGGWIYVKFAAAQTLIAGKAYLIRLVASTGGAFSFATNGTSNNWQRMLVLNTTAAPAAGDDMHVLGTIDGGPGGTITTCTAVVVTQDNNDATDYGSAQTNAYVAALDVSNGGTLAWVTAADSQLRLSGHLKVYNSGVLSMGTVATPVQRGKTAILEFDCAANGDFGFKAMAGSTVTLQGLSRTSGKNVSQTLLTADAAAAATSLTVADDTGWLNGDSVALAATSQTPSHAEDKALSADAGASTLTIAAITNAHLGTVTTGGVTVNMQAEVVLLTRNVIIRAVNSSFRQVATRWISSAGVPSSFDCDWACFRLTQGNSIEVLSGTSLSFDHCLVWGIDAGATTGAWYGGSGGGAGASDTVALRNCQVYDILSTAAQGVYLSSGFSFAGVGDRFVVDKFTFIGRVAGGGTVGTLSAAIKLDAPDPRFAIGELRGSSATYALWLNSLASIMAGRKWGPIYTHSNNTSGSLGHGMLLGSTTITGLRFDSVYSWHNGSTGLLVSGADTHDIRFEGETVCIGNATSGLNWSVTNNSAWYFRSVRCAGSTSFAQTIGLNATAALLEILMDAANLGTATGILVAHTTRDISFNSVQVYRVALTFRNTVMASASEISPTALALTQWTPTSFLAFERKDGVAGAHEIWTSLGKVTIENGTVKDAPGAKLTPSISTLGSCAMRLDSSGLRPGRGFMVGVNNGNSVQVSVYAQKDGSYTGSQPRLILKANGALGILADVVLASMTVGTGTWEILTGTTAAVTDDGVLEFVVDCDGTAGNVFVNQWTSGSATPTGDEPTWFDGLAYKTAGASIPPSSGGTGRGRVQRGM